MPRTPSQMLFAQVADRSEDQLDLDVASLLVGEWEYERLDLGHYRKMLDYMASAAARRIDAAEPFAAIRAINRTLFEVQGFRGNRVHYYDPKNSFLCDVLDRRTGIPITLSVVYIEVARRMGVTVKGVGFPGHFLVRHDVDHESTLILDPFRRGAVRSVESLQELLQSAAGRHAQLTPTLLEPSSKRQILVRMLHNLVGIYTRNGDVTRLTEALERILILEPHNEELEERLEQLRAACGQDIN